MIAFTTTSVGNIVNIRAHDRMIAFTTTSVGNIVNIRAHDRMIAFTTTSVIIAYKPTYKQL
jgi:uncharacterized protein YcbX